MLGDFEYYNWENFLEVRIVNCFFICVCWELVDIILWKKFVKIIKIIFIGNIVFFKWFF